MGEGRSHWSSMVLRKSQTCFFDRHTHPNSMYSNFCHVLNEENLNYCYFPPSLLGVGNFSNNTYMVRSFIYYTNIIRTDWQVPRKIKSNKKLHNVFGDIDYDRYSGSVIWILWRRVDAIFDMCGCNIFDCKSVLWCVFYKQILIYIIYWKRDRISFGLSFLCITYNI